MDFINKTNVKIWIQDLEIMIRESLNIFLLTVTILWLLLMTLLFSKKSLRAVLYPQMNTISQACDVSPYTNSYHYSRLKLFIFKNASILN